MKMKRRDVYTGKPVERKYMYTPAVVAVQAGLVFVSGQAGWDDEGNLVGIGDPAVQARKAFENLRDVLVAAGASLGGVIKETEYMTDIAYLRAISRARREFFPSNFPAATLVEVKGLFLKDQVFEIDVVATLD
jgi:enamine deaminase RidA (YjgF/YER057c/UK114 family)